MEKVRLLLKDVNRAIIKIRGAYPKWAKENKINYHELFNLTSIICSLLLNNLIKTLPVHCFDKNNKKVRPFKI